MTHIARGLTGAILDHYATVIEGSASYDGIPGSASNDPVVNADPTLTASSGSTTTMAPSSPSTAVVNKDLAPSQEAPFFLLCTSASDASNTDAARKISVWDGTTFTVVKAFDAAVAASDTFKLAQGFRRIPNGIDLLAEEGAPATGWDRFFQLEAMPGEILPFYGKGLRTYLTDLVIRLRIMKHGRGNDAKASVFENLRIIRDAITKSDNIEPTYTRQLFAEGGSEEILEDDTHKVVGQITLKLQYRVDLSYK